MCIDYSVKQQSLTTF